MPVVVAGAAISAIAAGSTFTLAAGLTLGFSMTAFAGSLVLGGLSYALSPKQKKQKATVPSSTIAVRETDLSRQFVYGMARITRCYAHMSTTDSNGRLHAILIICDGPIRSMREIWVDDQSIPEDWIDANGNVTQGSFAGKLVIRKHLGGTGQAADSLAVANMPEWTADHRLQGIAYLYLILTKDQNAFPNGVPNITAIVEGREIYDPRTEMLAWSPNICLFANDFLHDARYAYGILPDDIDDANTGAQASICDEIVTTPSTAYAVSSVDAANDRVTIAGTLLALQYCDRVTASSTGSLPGGLSAATPYYVVPYQIKDTCRILLATSLVNAIARNVIDITSAGSGTITLTKTGEPRYHGGGIVDTDDNLSSTLAGIVSGMAGRAISVGGFWTLWAGAWRTPVLDLRLDASRAAVEIRNCLSMTDSYNIVRGKFTGPESMFQPTDYPSAQYAQYIEDDGGNEAILPLDLPFTSRPMTAQRIAKIELLRGRQDIGLETIQPAGSFAAQTGDNVTQTDEQVGWDHKAFEITDLDFDLSGGPIVIKMQLRETAEEIFTWASGEALPFDPAPNSNLPSTRIVEAPTGVSYNSRLASTTAGDGLYVMQLQWDPHPNAFVRQNGRFEIQFKKTTDVDWLPGFWVDGTLTQTDVFTALVGTTYDMRIRAINNLGAKSPWSTIAGAVAGSSGGVTITEDWETFSDPIGSGLMRDYETFSDPVGSGDIEDRGYFT
jgi:hypothetical protein